MEYFDLGCSIVLRVLWAYAGVAIFFRKMSFTPFTDTKWGARAAGAMFVAAVAIDTYHKWFAN